MQTSSNTSSRLGLRGKLLLVTLPLVNIAFIGVWFLATRTARDGLTELSQSNLAQGAQSLAGALQQSVDDSWSDAVTTARLDLANEALDSADPKNFSLYANELVRTKGKYAAMFVADARGEIVASNTLARSGKAVAAPIMGRTIASEPWFAVTLAAPAGQTTIVNRSRPEFLLPNLNEDEFVAGFSLPIFNVMEEPVGTLTVLVSLTALGEQLQNFVVEKDGQVDSLAVVVDATGAVALLPPTFQGSAAWRRAAIPQTATQLEQPWSAPNQKQYQLLSSTVRGQGTPWNWKVYALKTVETLEAPVKSISARLLWAFGLAIFLTTTVLVVMTTRFLFPIRRLTEATSGTERASDFTPIPVTTTDEVGTLTGAFNRMLSNLKEYQTGLERKVEERTHALKDANQEVSDILDNMKQAIFTVNREQRINPQFSKFSQSVFGQQPLAGEPVLQVLQLTPERDLELSQSMGFWFQNIIDADELQWCMAEGEAVRSLTLERKTAAGDVELRYLELDYAPMYKDGLVAKVMVVAKDVTELRDLKAEVLRKDQENKDNLTRFAEIAAMDPALFRTFMDESNQLLERCDSAAVMLDDAAQSKEGVNELFRAMHTLKGNARIFAVTSLQKAAHAVENYFEKLRDTSAEVPKESIGTVKHQIVELRQMLGGFEALSRQIVSPRTAQGAEDGSIVPSQRGHISVPEARIVELKKAIKELSRGLGTSLSEAALADLQSQLWHRVYELTTVPVSELYGRCRKIVNDLAGELGKEVGDLRLEGGEVMVDAKQLGKMSEVVLHALRNCLDHGIEAPAEREAAGKPRAGTISIGCSTSGSAFEFVIEDDGRGVDLQRVKAKAFERRLVAEEHLETLSEKQLIDFLFEPGFSLARQVSDISGRGVGMDVIKNTIEQLGGTVALTSRAGRGVKLTMRISDEIGGI